MKKTTTVVTAAILFSTILATVAPSFAADLEPLDTKGKVSFTKDENNDGKVPPVSPEKPGGEVDPGGEPGGNQQEGPLAINFAPNFDFGERKISLKEETYNAKPQKDKVGNDVPNFVQVKDIRGTGAGWKLSVTQEKQFEVAEGEEGKEQPGQGQELRGAQIVLKNAEVSSELEDDFKPKSLMTTDATLIPGKAQDLMSADVKQGMGLNSLKFGSFVDSKTGEESVQLIVPGTANPYEAEYTSTLLWSLSDAPGNAE